MRLRLRARFALLYAAGRAAPRCRASSMICAIALLLAGAQSFATAEPSAQPLYDVAVREAWIPMKDGVRLSATLYVPTAKRPGEKFPAVLEYLPYRKDELQGHVKVHDYFARRGFVSARVDIRGTGRSQGHTPDREYSQVEQEDAEQVIAWLAHQGWSNGSVGMFGISWGGFNSLQMAMRNPPGLKAIIAICATEDLFHDDVHFIDGMMHVDEYELNVDLQNAMTRSPDFPTDEASLAERFDNPPWFVMYKQHPRAGAFWEAPVRPLESIKVPVFMIGGMLDGYRDSIPRMLERIKAPTKALLGPWNHSEPHDAVPGPAIEWRGQAVEWWTRWMKPQAARALEGPRLAVYMNHWYPPDVHISEIPGNGGPKPAGRRRMPARRPGISPAITRCGPAPRSRTATNSPTALPPPRRPAAPISGGEISTATSARSTPTAWSTTPLPSGGNSRFSAGLAPACRRPRAHLRPSGSCASRTWRPME